MLIDPVSGKKLVTPDEACKIYGCCKSNLRVLYMSGELSRFVESERRVYYYLDEVTRIAKKKAQTRKKRGGRPRSTEAA